MYGNEVYDYAEDVLSHHGVPGQKKGVRNGPPYPLDPNPSKQAERKRASKAKDKIASAIDNFKKRKKKKAQAAALAKARQAKSEKAEAAKKEKEAAEEEKKKKAQHEKDRVEAIKSGSASDVMKYKGELTEAELNSAINRINAEKRLAVLADEESVANGKKIMKKALDGMQGVTDFANKSYNLISSLVKFKSFIPEGDKKSKSQTEASKLLKALNDKDAYEKNKDEIEKQMAWIKVLQSLEKASDGKPLPGSDKKNGDKDKSEKPSNDKNNKNKSDKK